MKRKKTTGKKSEKKASSSTDKKVCFVISPIGKEGSASHKEFKEILDYVIKPAFEEYSVIRADDINRAGSFIKDILENIYSSFIVLADLSGQNPNVFYELGVRHSLRPRTILIAQNLDDIPSDLREYRTIIYDTSARGASRFKKKINEFLKEIYKEPERADNPVLDRLGSITDSKLTQVESERDELKKELTMFLSWKKKTSEHRVSTEVRKRFNRILCLKNAKQQSSFSLDGHDGTFKRGENKFSLPLGQGNFKLYFLSYKEIIKEFWYVSIHETSASIIEELADVRVLLENCSKDQEAVCDFILVVGSEIPNKKEYHKKFNQMKKKINKNYQKFFNFHLLDPVELEKWEKELALKV